MNAIFRACLNYWPGHPPVNSWSSGMAGNSPGPLCGSLGSARVDAVVATSSASTPCNWAPMRLPPGQPHPQPARPGSWAIDVHAVWKLFENASHGTDLVILPHVLRISTPVPSGSAVRHPDSRRPGGDLALSLSLWGLRRHRPSVQTAIAFPPRLFSFGLAQALPKQGRLYAPEQTDGEPWWGFRRRPVRRSNTP